MAESKAGRDHEQRRLQKAGRGGVMETLLRYITYLEGCERLGTELSQDLLTAWALQIHGGEGRTFMLCSPKTSQSFLTQMSFSL